MATAQSRPSSRSIRRFRRSKHTPPPHREALPGFPTADHQQNSATMTRIFCISALLCLSAWLPGQTPSPEAPAGTTIRPNIVFAFADDWGRYASAYAKLEPGGANDVVSTPNFDRVASEGVLFTNSYVNAPSCTPCRSSLLSGQYFWRTRRGAILQGAVWDRSIPSYPLILQNKGYHIGFTYKVWSPGTPRDDPHGGAARGYMKRGRRFNQFSQFVSKAKDPEVAKQRLYQEVRDNFRDFLADRKPGQPFCYWFGPTNVHRRWTQGSGKKLWGIDPDKLKGKMPKDLPDVPVVRQDLADYFGEVQAFDASLGVILEELEKSGEIENTIVVVSGDHGAPGFPRGKCNLYDMGVAVPLAIRWPKHFPGGRVVTDFVNLPDLAPTFLEAAGCPVPKDMTAQSLVPVLSSEKAGRVDPTRDHVVVGRERHVFSAQPDMTPYPQRALRTDGFLLIRNFRPERWPMGTGPGYGETNTAMPSYEKLRNNTMVAFDDLDASPTKAWLVTHRNDPEVTPWFEMGFGRRPEFELYDLQKDPHQRHNVAQDPAYAVTLEELSRRLMKILVESKDPRVTQNPIPFEHPPFTGPLTGSKKKPKKRAKNIASIPPDLVVPPLVKEAPGPGKRVARIAKGFEATTVYHSLYLPVDWKPDGRYPVIVEYPGNGPFRNKLGDVSSGRVDGCQLGYGISGGRGAILIALPFVAANHKQPQLQWWGDVEATVDYCKVVVAQVCKEFGGNPGAVFLAGFSRGAIACNFIGLHDEAIASLWRGFICHSHYDGVRKWPYPGHDRKAAQTRLMRLGNRPQFISHEVSARQTRRDLKSAHPDGEFTFWDLNFQNHTASWVLRDIPARRALRKWFAEVLAR